ncbi:hypothetical protein [Streptomyces sp. NBRC 109706]|uniref:hypothetical protein n=1 Tax=Streptomyces sp. NBRC 109706 TaxID=1550035 RepID=UPI000785E64B|nr:hypothetical protein [Streptomyces sp. NBRC 109706]
MAMVGWALRRGFGGAGAFWGVLLLLGGGIFLSWVVYAVAVGLWLATALPLSVRFYVRGLRARAARARSAGLDEVRLDRWRRRGPGGLRREAAWGAHRFELRLPTTLGIRRGVLRDGDGWQWFTLSRWDQHPGPLAWLIDPWREKARLWIPSAAPRTVSFYRGADGVRLHVDDGRPYLLTPSAVRFGARELALGDVLGWRIARDLSPEETAVCALAMLSALTDPLPPRR